MAPTTTAGRWAVGLALAGVALVFAWTLLPGGAVLGFACELAGGIAARSARAVPVRDRVRARRAADRPRL